MLSASAKQSRIKIQPVQPGVDQPLKRGVGPTAADYKQYDHRTFTYMKSDTYVGSDEPLDREEWLFNFETGHIEMCPIDLVPAVERIFMEILSNASDNVGRSRRKGVDPGPIEILMNNSTISVTNYGLPIPVEMHPEGKYVPDMIFGSFFAGSNYDVDCHDAGKNGIGAKAANIFSKEFMVIVHDCGDDRRPPQKYTQVWRDNMLVAGDPVIEPYTGKRSSTQVVYVMDFARFKYPVPQGDEGGYPLEALGLFARHAIDTSFTAKTPVFFNGQEFSFPNIRDYARLYFGDAVETGIIHYQWPPGTEIVRKKNGYQVSKTPGVVPDVEMIVLDTPDEGKHVSFANCLMTREGGVHVQAAYRAVGASIVRVINESVLKRMVKQNKGKELSAQEKRSHTINIDDVKPHMSLLLSVRVVNSKHTSQSKTCLLSPVPKITVGEEELRSVNRWQLIDRLYAALDAKQFASLSKQDGKLKRYVRLKKGVDANNAGKALRHQCVLYITEGQSGAGYANKLLGLIPGNRDFIGVLPMRGKGLNVMNAFRIQIEKNAEINELKKMLGLTEGIDYADQANFNRLRYGAIMIMADSDVDGKHIIGLILNFFFCCFPSLLARGFVMYYRTPTLRVTSGKTVLKFYTQREYDEWREATPNFRSWEHMYYKGLGTSTDAEIKDDFQTPRIVSCFYDDQAPAAMRLAFDKNMTHQRKDWIRLWQPLIGVDEIHMQPISWFINHELILFSIADIHRSIPKLMDGFKEALRKIMHGAHLKWKIGSKKAYLRYKIAQFAGFLAEKSCYQHGELNLDDVIVGMAQDFVGANNIPWFCKEGQFGTRYEGGKDASQTRYTFTRPETLVSYILRKADQPILKHLVDEGQTIEPETYYPVIPMILVNGAQGIGTGYSTFIPNHNPLDLIKWLRLKLQGFPDEELPNLIPWYRGFRGTIHIFDRSQRRRRLNVNRNGARLEPETLVKVTTINNETSVPQITTTEVEESSIDHNLADEALTQAEADAYDVEEVQGSRPLLSFISLGSYQTQLNGPIIITELPIGSWPLTYRKWLEDMVEEKKITGYKDNSRDDSVYFEIEGFKDTPNHRTLKLKRSLGMSNMVVLDDDNRPIRYDTAHDIIEAFYVRRLPIYARRKDYMVENVSREINKLTEQQRFVRAVVDGQLVIFKRPKDEILAHMAHFGFDPQLLKSTALDKCTHEKVQQLMQQIETKEAERAQILARSPESMWLQDLDELEAKYRSIFPQETQLQAHQLKVTSDPARTMFSSYTGVKTTRRRKAALPPSEIPPTSDPSAPPSSSTLLPSSSTLLPSSSTPLPSAAVTRSLRLQPSQ
jgi:DNA topoisomerase-2